MLKGFVEWKKRTKRDRRFFEIEEVFAKRNGIGLILRLTCANISSAVKLMLSSLSACSISLLFCSTRLSMASCSSWLWDNKYATPDYEKRTERWAYAWRSTTIWMIKWRSDSRCCLVPLVNPVKLEVNVWFDQHSLPCVKVLLNLQQQLFLWAQIYQECNKVVR